MEVVLQNLPKSGQVFQALTYQGDQRTLKRRGLKICNLKVEEMINVSTKVSICSNITFTLSNNNRIIVWKSWLGLNEGVWLGKFLLMYVYYVYNSGSGAGGVSSCDFDVENEGYISSLQRRIFVEFFFFFEENTYKHVSHYVCYQVCFRIYVLY